MVIAHTDCNDQVEYTLNLDHGYGALKGSSQSRALGLTKMKATRFELTYLIDNERHQTLLLKFDQLHRKFCLLSGKSSTDNLSQKAGEIMSLSRLLAVYFQCSWGGCFKNSCGHFRKSIR